MEQLQGILDFVDHLMANSTPQAPAWNLEHTIEKRDPAWNYIDGCMIKAILDLYYATDEQKYFDFAKNYIDFYLQEDGSILGFRIEDYNCDNINMGKVLFDLYAVTKDEKYHTAIELLMKQVKSQPRIKAGNFWHKQIYPNQVWLDGLYMVQPFLMAYENGKYADDVRKQFKNVHDMMRDPETGLYFHGYDEAREMFWADKETGLSKNFWTRSIGWFAMAMVDTPMPDGLKGLMDAVLKMADKETGLFYQVTNAGGREGNYLETSGSCAIAYALMKGARLNFLPDAYYGYGKKIFDAVAEHKLDKDKFVLRDVCLVAGLGGMPGKGDYQPRDGTFEYYISEPRVDNDAKGVAPFLFSTAEVIRYENRRKSA